MGRLSSKLRSVEGGRLAYWCQGCNGTHQVAVGEGPGPRWGWNGDVDRPTFTPSVLVTWSEPSALDNPVLLQQQLADKRAGLIDKIPQTNKACHTFITDGRVQFLGDCTHALAGQTLDLPDLPGGEA